MTEASGNQPTVKQKREMQRAEKVAAFQREQRVAQRNRRIGITSAIVGGVAVVALIVTFIVTGSEPKQRPQDIAIDGVTEFKDLPSNHIDTVRIDYAAEYGMTPPAGGDHSQMWLNCGVYSEPQRNENAVHSLEHGAVWVTYNPDTVSDDEVAALQKSLPSTYIILSPYPDLPAPIVASAWGAQVELESADDPRLTQFIDKYWKSASAPEPGAACTGAYEGEGRVA